MSVSLFDDQSLASSPLLMPRRLRPRVLRTLGTYPPQADTWLLAELLAPRARERRVLDVCTGTGALAVVAGRAGAASVAAVDLSARSVACAMFNARLNRVSVRALRGDLVAPVAGERFDLVVCNPPYVPSGSDVLPRHSLGRCWDAGRDGRAVLDRFCEQVPSVLAPGGTVLVTHSDLTNEAETMDLLAARGLEPCIEASISIPFGPVMQARASRLMERGLLDQGRAYERLVVVSARSADGGDPR